VTPDTLATMQRQDPGLKTTFDKVGQPRSSQGDLFVIRDGLRLIPSTSDFFLFFLFFSFFLYIQMFFYTIMKLFITLLENVNKSCTSVGSLSLNQITKRVQQTPKYMYMNMPRLL
jgi:hypothetical protein